MKKIILISFEYFPYKDGGLSRYSYELTREFFKLKNIKFKLIIGFPKNHKKPKENYIIPIEVEFYNNKILSYLFFSWKVYFKLIFMKNKENFIIHALNPWSYFFIPKIKKVKFVLTEHNIISKQINMAYGSSILDKILRYIFYIFFSFWERHLCQTADKIIAVSKSTKNDLMRFYNIPNKKIEVIYNGINFKNFSPVKIRFNKKRRNLLFVGRIVPRKGLEYLVETIFLIKKEISDIKLYIVGKGENDYLIKLKKMIKKMNLEKNIKFLGFIEDKKLNKVYSMTDIFVFPSLVEGFGLVLLEAMTKGKPIVATNIGGVNEVIINGRDGILVEPKKPKKMAEAIIKLINDDKLYNKFSQNAIKSVKNFSWKKSAKKVYEIYNHLS
ncbi:MAG: GT4 family glycosyltransferase PelF [Candidatus Aenigmarchaeota archaeon]|nr:GT4 family glycosyltransferase PelF [Candidatus Aenigmarchaeota archaeon]